MPCFSLLILKPCAYLQTSLIYPKKQQVSWKLSSHWNSSILKCNSSWNYCSKSQWDKCSCLNWAFPVCLGSFWLYRVFLIFLNTEKIRETMSVIVQQLPLIIRLKQVMFWECWGEFLWFFLGKEWWSWVFFPATCFSKSFHYWENRCFQKRCRDHTSFSYNPIVLFDSVWDLEIQSKSGSSRQEAMIWKKCVPIFWKVNGYCSL